MSRTTTFFLCSCSAVLALAAGIALEAQDPSAAPGSPFAFPERAPEKAERREAPLELTSSEGVGLRLVALDARAVVEPPLAFTELHLTFANPEDRVLEGRFHIALPPGAAISRFAMKIGGSWQEGEVVERQKARRAYEDFLHRRQDPALLEQEAGNEFSARVFPIPARAEKEIVISYSHALPRAADDFVIPLRGLPEIGRLDIRAILGERPAGGASSGPASSLGGQVSDRRMVTLSRQDWTPDRDFAVAQDAVGTRAGLRHGNLVVARVAPAIAEEAQKIRGLYLLVDSSASRALGFEKDARLAAELLRGLRAGSRGAAPIGLAAFDQVVAPVFEGAASGLAERDLAALAERRPLGASDLAGALGWLAGRLKGSPGRFPRVLILTDGIVTAGETEPAVLKAAVRALRAAGVERVDVLAAGGLRDDALLRELVQGNLQHDGAVIDADAPLEEIARRLTLACRAAIAVKVPGASWVWPESLDGFQPGDQALVYADLPEGRPLQILLDGKKAELAGEIAAAERPLLERQWVTARIERLQHLRAAAAAGDEDLSRALALQITELSIRHRVLSPLTAFLVLETEADYQRYGLDRRSLADILTVGAGGLEVLARTPPPVVATPAPDRKIVPVMPVDLPADGEAMDEDAAVEETAEAAGDSVAPVEIPEVAGSVPGGVAGGVPGGVAGGIPGGTPQVAGGRATGVDAASVPAPPPPPPAAPRPEPAADDAPLRVGGRVDETISERIQTEDQLNRRQRREAHEAEQAETREEVDRLAAAMPYEGRFAEVMAMLARGEKARARKEAEAWRAESPGDLLALLALGETAEAAGEKGEAARAYGSLIDLYPSRADLRRYAGERLERLGREALPLVIDTYAKAAADRPDHASGHRLLAWALAGQGRFEEAFAALEKGLDQKYPEGRFAEVERVMREDLGLVAAAWLRQQPGRRNQVLARLRGRYALLAEKPGLRFVLTWETDANDVDLHVYDNNGGHAYYQKPDLASGGRLYADVTTGFGPECFAIPKEAKQRAAPYRLAAHYYSRGPMGFGMGLLQVIESDGRGGITVDPRPFIVMRDQAMVDLGSVPAAK